MFVRQEVRPSEKGRYILKKLAITRYVQVAGIYSAICLKNKYLGKLSGCFVSKAPFFRFSQIAEPIKQLCHILVKKQHDIEEFFQYFIWRQRYGIAP